LGEVRKRVFAYTQFTGGREKREIHREKVHGPPPHEIGERKKRVKPPSPPKGRGKTSREVKHWCPNGREKKRGHCCGFGPSVAKLGVKMGKGGKP